MQVSNEYSQAINIVKVLCMFGVVYIHASIVPYIDCSPAMLYYQQLMTRVLPSFAVPGFFMCSGFLYFLNYHGIESYKRKSISRLKSLIIPYLFWISFTLLITWFLQDVLGLAHLFGAGHMKLIRNFTLNDFFNSFWAVRDGAPFLSTMWFLRDLIVCMVLTPLFYLLLKGKYGRWALGVILILSLTKLSFFHVGVSSIFWFSVGAFVAINNIDVFTKIKTQKKILIAMGGMLVLAYCMVYTENREIGLQSYFISILQMLTTLVLFSNTLLLSMILVGRKWGYRLAKLGTPSYFIYLAHEPYMGYILQLFIKSVSLLSSSFLFFGFVSITPIVFPFIIILMCLVIFKIMRKYCPKVLSFMVGGKV